MRGGVQIFAICTSFRLLFKYKPGFKYEYRIREVTSEGFEAMLKWLYKKDAVRYFFFVPISERKIKFTNVNLTFF